MKKTTKRAFVIIAAALIAASSFAGCDEASVKEKLSSMSETSTASADADAVNTPDITAPSLDETEQAIAEQGLTVNNDGEIVDAQGSKVETTENGTVKITTEDGSTVEVSTEKVQQTNQKTSSAATQNSTSQSSSQSKQTSQSHSSTQSSNSTSSKTQNSTSSKTSTSNSSKAQSSANSSSKAESSKPSSSQPSQTSQSSKSSQTSQSSQASQTSQASDPHAGKTWHEAVYKTVNHPAETKQVKVVDQEAYSYEEPVYEWRTIAKCKDCGIDLSQLTQEERTAHSKNHVLNEGGDGGWHTAREQVQVGTRTVEVPEQSHMETVVVKEAWSEQVLVREAGWY